MMENDPLADEDAGPCTKCELGWVTVKPAYAQHLFPNLTLQESEGMDPATLEHVQGVRETQRRAAANSVYPCRRCRPAQFYRWAGGHFALGHDLTSCAECIEVMGGPKAARRAARAYPDRATEPQPRRDIDS